MKQWKCPTCGAWVDAGWWRHVHVKLKEPDLGSIMEARLRGDLDPLGSAEVNLDTYMRTGKEPTREEPDGNP